MKMILKKFKYNDIQQCHFLNNKNNKNCIIHIKRINISLTWKRIQVLKVLYWK